MLCFAQQNSTPAPASDAKGTNTASHDAPASPAQEKPPEVAKPSDLSDDANIDTMHSMENHHMDMGPHMKMTALRPIQPGDEERAQKVVVAARAVVEKYKDYHLAIKDGFKIFHPEIPQKQYHFTNARNAIRADFKFDPDNPTSLLYEKEGDGYRIVGVMFTAARRFTEDDLNQFIPLSIAQWHEHVNFCQAPAGHIAESIGPNAKFGFHGSIATKAECDAGGGKFIPLLFNWMIHVYPLEKDEAHIWDVEKPHQHTD
jgi:hypothetical protein